MIVELFFLQIIIPTDRTSGTRTRATQMLTYKFVEMCSTPWTTAPRRPNTKSTIKKSKLHQLYFCMFSGVNNIPFFWEQEFTHFTIFHEVDTNNISINYRRWKKSRLRKFWRHPYGTYWIYRYPNANSPPPPPIWLYLLWEYLGVVGF